LVYSYWILYFVFLKDLSYEEMLRVGAVQPREQKAAGTTYCGLPVPEGSYKRAGEGIFTRV